MDDNITSDEFERIIGALKASAEALGRITVERGGGKRGGKVFPSADEFDKQLRAINKHVGAANQSIATLASNAEGLSRGLKNFLKEGVLGLMGGKVVADIIEAGEHLYKNYQNLADVGETFGGSMLNMVKAADEANLPLDEFATMIKRNSVAAAQLSDRFGRGATSLGSLNKTVQNNLKQFGFFGMSLNEVADVTGDYAETMRLANTASYKNKQAMSDQITQFATDISLWSAATGADRKKLSEDANELLRNVSLNSITLTDDTRKAVEGFSVGMAALPGGKEIAAGINDILAAKAEGFTAASTEFGQSLIKTGVGSQLLETYDQVASKMLSGQRLTTDQQMDLIDQNNKFLKENGTYLERQKRGGNADAALWEERLVQGKGFNRRDSKEKMEQAKKQGAITAIFSEIEYDFTKISSTFKDAMLQGLLGIDNPDDPKQADAAKKKVGELFKTVGAFASQFGKLVGSSLKDFINNLPKILSGFEEFIDVMTKALPAIEKVTDDIGFVLGKMLDGLGYIHKRILGWFGDEKASPVGRGVALVGTALAGLAAFMAGKKLFGALIDLPGMLFKQILGSPRTVQIQAGAVYVNGKSTGGGGSVLGEPRTVQIQAGAVYVNGKSTGGGGSDFGGGDGAKKAEKEAVKDAEKTAEQEAVKDAEKTAGKKGILGSIKSGLGSLFKGNKFTRALGTIGEKYLASKSGSGLMEKALSGNLMLSRGLSSAGSWLGGAARATKSYGGMAINMAKGGLGAAGKWIGEKALKLITKAFGPAIGALIAASSAAPQIFEAYGYYQSGKISSKDFASILINTLGPAAVGALAGWGGEVAGGAAGTLVAPGLGTLAGAVGGSIAGGYAAGEINKHLFDEDSVTKKLQAARDATATAAGTDGRRKSAISDVLAQAMGDRDNFAMDNLSPAALQASMPAVPTDPTKLQSQFQDALDKEPDLEKKVKDTANDSTKANEHTKLLKELNDNIMKLVAIQVQANAQSLNLQKRQISATNNQGQH